MSVESSNIKGGAGSGNFGHAGRPGEVGGSGVGGVDINSEAFKKWFGDSKVVNDDGKPLRAFHGTTKDFAEFDPKLGKQHNQDWAGDVGSWFSAESKYKANYDEENAEYQASVYTEDRHGDHKEGANILPVYLSIQNPVEYQDWEDFADTKGRLNGSAFKEKLISKGYDGIVIRNSNTDGFADRDDWIAFHPSQIKSAIGNRGTFDSNDPDITKSLKASPEFSGFLWNPYMRAFAPLIGKPVDTSALRKTVSEIRRASANRMASLAQGVLDGEITNLAEFAIEFKASLKNLYLSTHVLARGGVAQMTQSDWGKLGVSLREQYSFADNFVRDIENERTSMPIVPRIEMYTDSAWGAAGEFENVVRDRELKLGSLERRVLGDADHCEECIELAERSWQPPSLLPDIGDTECGPGCQCIASPESRVTTKRGLVPISDIIVGDFVLTHKKRWRKVTATRKIPVDDRQIYSVTNESGKEVLCTDDHRWLTGKGWLAAKDICEKGIDIKTI